MRIIHVSYKLVPDCTDPHAWLSRLAFFTVMLETTAAFAKVMSVHLIRHRGVVVQKGVEYHFLKPSRFESSVPLVINRYLKKLEPNVIFVHGLVFPLQVLMLRQQLGPDVKLVMVHHSERPLRYHKKWLQVLADRIVDGYFFTSMAIATEWHKNGLIRNLSHVHEVMINSSIFYPVDRRVAIGRTNAEGEEVFLWVGHMDTNKDPHTLIKAFKMFSAENPRKTLYMIYQKTDLLPEIKTLVADCNNILLVGKVDHHDLLYWYNSADFIISTSHYEGGGTAVCEAMSCGCIPIVSRIPSFCMMTDNGKIGFLFQPGNVVELTDALAKSAKVDISRERRRTLELYQERLSNDAIVKKTMSVLNALQEV